jgi:hypothetical protein
VEYKYKGREKEYFKEYRKNNKEKFKKYREAKKEYYEEYQKKYQKKYYQENKNKLNKQARQYQSKNKEKIRKQHREYYLKNKKRKYEQSRRWVLDNPQKTLAHRQTYNAIQKGFLVKQSCEICGSTLNIEAHHPDYNKPLNIIWLCRDCHKLLHKTIKIKKEGNCEFIKSKIIIYK